MSLSSTFAATGNSSSQSVDKGQVLSYSISGTFVGTVLLEFSGDNGQSWETLRTMTAARDAIGLTAQKDGLYRFRCSSLTSGVITYVLTVSAKVVREIMGRDGNLLLRISEDGLEFGPIKGTPTGLLAYDPGSIAVNTLRVASDVVSAETVTTGADVYEVEIVNTDSTDTCLAGSFNTTAQVSVLAADYPHLLTTLGSVIRIENEILRLIATGTTLTYSRGACGTTAAAHVNTTAIYKGDGVVAGRIPMGLVTTLTPTAFTAALVATINARGTLGLTAVLISVNEVLIKASAVGATVTACTETLGGANNAWAATAMYGGRAQAVKKLTIQKRVPLALEVTLDHMQFQFDFTPTLVQVFVAPTATPGAYKIWDGAVTITAGLVTVDNAGAVDWAATDTVTVVAMA